MARYFGLLSRHPASEPSQGGFISNEPDGPIPLELRWTTDPAICASGNKYCGVLGPDGPWQAVSMEVGEPRGTPWSLNIPLFPVPTYGSYVLTPSVGGGGGGYRPDDSMTANTSAALNFWQVGPDQIDSMMEKVVYNDRIRVSTQNDTFALNVTLGAVTKWHQTLPDGRHWMPNFGTFGLLPATADSPLPRTYVGNATNARAPGPLDLLKARQVIASNSYGMHMGSVALGIPASLVLGGFAQNRVLGPAITAWYVTIGVEEGGSPFAADAGVSRHQAKSLWQAQDHPAPTNLIYVDPRFSFIGLPDKVCESIARMTGSTWRDDIKYYVWNPDSPLSRRVVTSPAYIGFVFTYLARNITIKIPFALLNLTLEPPIVNVSTAYLPCQPTGDNTAYLGRAFLQGAYVAYNFDANCSFIAQAPGPGMARQSSLKILMPMQGTMNSDATDDFAGTWRSHWTVLPEDESFGRGLSRGAVAGIVIGAVSMVVVCATLCWIRWRRPSANQGEKKELDGDASRLHEATADVRREMAVPVARHELVVAEPPQELPAGRVIRCEECRGQATP